MSGPPEAAASLFGSADDGADPFAQAIDSSDPFPPPDNTPAPTQSVYHHPQAPSSYEPPPKPVAAGGGSWSQPPAVSQQYAPVANTAPAGGYGQPSYGASSYSANTAQAPAYNPSRYQPVQAAAPQQTYAPDRYAPPPQPAAPAAAPAANPHPYDYSRSTSSSYATNSYITPAQPSVTAPAPPAPKATLSRPKVVNAYDPPFPTTSSRRTNRQSSGSYGSYSAYQPAQPLPPPSPFYATNGFAGQQQQSQTPPPPPARGQSHFATPPPAGPIVRNTSLPYGTTQAYGAPPVSKTPDYGAPPPPRSQSRGSAYSQYQPPPPPNPPLMNGAVPVDAAHPPSHYQAPPARPVPPRTIPTPQGQANGGYQPHHAYAQPSTITGYEQSPHPPAAKTAPTASYEQPMPPSSDKPATDDDFFNGGYEQEEHVSTFQDEPKEQVNDVDFFDGDYEGGEQTTEAEDPEAVHDEPTSFVDGQEEEQPPPSASYLYGASPYAPPTEDIEPEAFQASSPPRQAATISSPPRAIQPNPYAPPAPTAKVASPQHRADPYAPAAAAAASSPPTSRYAPLPASNLSSPPRNPYAPVAAPSQPPAANPYGPPPVPQQQPADPYAPAAAATNPYAPPPAGPATNAYAPPANLSIKPTPNPYAVPPQPAAAQAAKPYKPYAPSRSNTLSVPGQQGYGSPEMPVQTLSYIPSTFKPPVGSPAVFNNAYAPSPSLVGANDPLSRVSARAPVFSFGFGGRLVTCFHGGESLSTGFDVALSSRNTTSIKIHTLNKLLTKSALGTSEHEFPGPLFADPSTQSLVRSVASAQAKKAKVIAYLDSRATEIGQGLGYFSVAERRTAEAKMVLVKLLKIMVENDGKLSGSATIDSAVRGVLVPQLSTESSAAGNFTVTADAQADGASLYSAGALTNSSFEQPISVTSLRPSALNKIEEFLMKGERKQAYVYALDQKLWAHAMVIASSIDKEAWKEVVNEFIQTELGSHEEQQQQPHSAHSTSSFASVPSVDPQATSAAGGGRDGLRVAYKFYSGQGPAAVQELVPKQTLSRPGGGLMPPTSLGPGPVGPGLTPRTPGFPVATLNLPAPESLSKWRDTIAMMLPSTTPSAPDTFLTLTALGDQLATYSWVEAAHVCYLLSPQTSPLGASGSPAARVTLVGSKPPHLSPTFTRNPDNFTFSEILEYAMSLVPLAKGQEPFSGVVHMQPYRLLHASSLAEMGYIQEANRYCDAITASISKPSHLLTPTFVAQLRLLVDRISGTSHSEKANSWMGGKIAKPSLDSIGGWLEGRFTKLVTGDGEDEPEKKNSNAEQKPFDGPFAQYSAISNGPSARSSPTPRQPHHNPNSNPYAPPQRTTSAMAMSSPYSGYQSYAPVDRASSAMDHHARGRSSPAPPVPAFPSHLNMAGVNSSLSKYATAPSSHSKASTTSSLNETSSQASPLEDSPSQETPVQTHGGAGGGSWWDYSSSGDGSGGASTPTVSSFMKVDEPLAGGENGGDGFISLMDAQSVGYTASPAAPPAKRFEDEEDDMEDLGFGNSKKKQEEGAEGEEGGKATEKKVEQRPAPKPIQKGLDEAPAGGGGWLSKWWKGGSKEGSSGPVKASLGEENSFYYDKDLKKWVNKKSGGDPTPAPAPPPPPSRSQTASPSRNAPLRPSPLGGGSTPPPRAASAMGGMATDGSTPPPARVRSNLVPSAAANEGGSFSSTPPPPSGPPGVGGPPPPMGGSRPPSTAPPGSPGPGSGPPSRPRSQAAKKNIRSRYVDVFSQEGGAS